MLKVQHLERHNRTIVSLLLIAAFVWSLSAVEWKEGLLHTGGINAILKIIGALFTPDLSPRTLQLAVTASWRTLAYATTGITLAIALALPLGIFASGVLCTSPAVKLPTAGFFRGLLGLMRAVHELVWAWLFVAAVGLTPFAAIFALAIPYAGILGRILADILNDVPRAPLEALRSSGASKLQLLVYGYLPISLADLISYTMYRFECAIRSAAIMSFVGLGGLGYQIQISLEDLRYHQVWTFIYFLVLLVILVDLWSNQLRKKLVT